MVLPLFSFAVPSLGLSTELTATIIGVLAVGGPEVFLLLAGLHLLQHALEAPCGQVVALLDRDDLGAQLADAPQGRGALL